MERIRLRAEAVEWRLVEGEVVVLDLRNSLYFAINETGAVLWQSLAEGAAVAELTELLREEFDVDEATAAADVTAFLQDLRSKALIDE